MKATKKIVGAACALVAAVALSAGSTFAWFATSSNVTATGMNIQAVVPANLYIAKGYETSVGDVNDTTINMAVDATDGLSPVAISTSEDEVKTGAITGDTIYALLPTSYSTDPDPDEAGVADAFGTAASAELATAGATWKNGSISTGEDTSVAYEYKDYVASSDMTLANKSEDINVNATVQVKFKKDSTALTYKFLRVGFIIGTPTVSGTTWSYEFVSNENTGTITLEDFTENETTYATFEFDYEGLIENFEKNSVRTITFIAWFDGEDEDCYVNNALNVSTMTISIAYKAGTATGGGAEDSTD